MWFYTFLHTHAHARTDILNSLFSFAWFRGHDRRWAKHILTRSLAVSVDHLKHLGRMVAINFGLHPNHQQMIRKWSVLAAGKRPHFIGMPLTTKVAIWNFRMLRVFVYKWCAPELVLYWKVYWCVWEDISVQYLRFHRGIKVGFPTTADQLGRLACGKAAIFRRCTDWRQWFFHRPICPRGRSIEESTSNLIPRI